MSTFLYVLCESCDALVATNKRTKKPRKYCSNYCMRNR